MQCCAAVQATYRKRKTPLLWVEGRGREGGRGVDFFVLWSHPIWGCLTILSNIVGYFNQNLILTINMNIFIQLIKHKETPGCPSPAPTFFSVFLPNAFGHLPRFSRLS